MKPIGTRRQAILFAVLAVLLIFFLVRWSSRGKPDAPIAPTGTVAAPARRPDFRASGRRSQRPTSPEEVPFLTERDLEPRLRGVGIATERDLFDLREPTPTPPPTPTPAPPPPPRPGEPGFTGPILPPPPPTRPPPPEPPFKLIGVFGPRDQPIAALLYGNDVINAREGDVVLVQWIVQKIGYESIDVGYVYYPPTESRRLPISQ